MRYRFVEDHRRCWPLRLMCELLGVSPAGYYGRRRWPPSARQERREALAGEIVAVHREVKARHGSPRIHAELAARGETCCVNSVAKLMRERGVAARAIAP